MQSTGKSFEQVMEDETWTHTSPDGSIDMIKSSDFFEHLLENDLTTVDFLDQDETNSDDPVRECMKKSLCVDEREPNVLSVEKIKSAMNIIDGNETLRSSVS